MTPDKRLQKIRRQSIGLWAVFVAVTVGSVAGNAIQAPDNWLSRAIAATAAVALFITVEILVHVQVDGKSSTFRRWAQALVTTVAVLSFVVSYHHLQTLAAEHGQGLASYAFPIFLDVVAILCTVYLVHLSGWRARLLAEVAPEPAAERDRDKGGRPEEPGSVRWERKVMRDRKAAGLAPTRSDPDSIAERILAEFGTDPAEWPGPKDLAERFGCARSTASVHRRKAADLVGEATTQAA